MRLEQEATGDAADDDGDVERPVTERVQEFAIIARTVINQNRLVRRCDDAADDVVHQKEDERQCRGGQKCGVAERHADEADEAEAFPGDEHMFAAIAIGPSAAIQTADEGQHGRRQNHDAGKRHPELLGKINRHERENGRLCQFLNEVDRDSDF